MIFFVAAVYNGTKAAWKSRKRYYGYHRVGYSATNIVQRLRQERAELGLAW